jgi:teichuronic acid exporter
MKLLKINFVRSVSTLAAATLATQGILLASMPLLTRLYSPVAFGMFATFSALHAMALIIFSLKYDIGIIVPREDGEARRILALSIFVPSCLSLLLLAILIIYTGWIVPSSSYLLLLPTSVLAASAYSALQQWGARYQNYRHYAISQVVTTTINLGLCFALGVFASGHDEGLVIGLSGGFLAGAAYMLWIWHPVFAKDGSGKRLPSLTSLWEVARKYRHMPFQVLPFTILIVIMQSAAPLVLGLHYSLAEVGLYALASRALLAPGAIIGAAIGEPFRAELAARMREGRDLRSLTGKLIAFLILVATAMYSCIYAVAPQLFELLFGQDYTRSGYIARALCIGAFAQFIILPLTYTFVISGHTKTGIKVQGAVALIPTIALYIASYKLPIERALDYWSISLIVSGTVLVIMVYRAASSPQTLKS